MIVFKNIRFDRKYITAYACVSECSNVWFEFKYDRSSYKVVYCSYNITDTEEYILRLGCRELRSRIRDGKIRNGEPFTGVVWG